MIKKTNGITSGVHRIIHPKNSITANSRISNYQTQSNGYGDQSAATSSMPEHQKYTQNQNCSVKGKKFYLSSFMVIFYNSSLEYLEATEWARFFYKRPNMSSHMAGISFLIVSLCPGRQVFSPFC